MSQVVLELNGLLSDQLECVSALFDLAKKETEALQENKLEELTKICNEVGSYTEELAALEQRRMDAHSEVAAAFGLPEEATISQVVSALASNEERETAGLVSETADNLKSAYHELREQNYLNQLLLKQSLSYIYRLNEAVGADNKLTYGKSGSFKQDNVTSFSSKVNRTV